ncbi:MAG: hypothetical protein IPJ98_20935, partial [Bryobacterales bacterium]|nr:hypothetical protein [Bryobacterales bacterium]
MSNDDRWQRAAAIPDELFALPEAERAEAWARHPENDAAVQAGAPDGSKPEPRKGIWMPICWRRGSRRREAGIGPWRLLEEIGQGRMSVVYRAERAAGYERRVAVKISIALPTRYSPKPWQKQILTRFELERRIAARLEHPSICKLRRRHHRRRAAV